MDETVVDVALNLLRETGVVFDPGLVAAGVNIEVVATASGIRLRIASRHGITDTYLVDAERAGSFTLESATGEVVSASCLGCD